MLPNGMYTICTLHREQLILAISMYILTCQMLRHSTDDVVTKKKKIVYVMTMASSHRLQGLGHACHLKKIT
jgi:hypothetical protein